jgi:hypothetical protein
MSMSVLLQKRMQYDCTVHGMRSSFRDWCAEMTAYPREVAELALAHLVGTEVERAYLKTDMLDRRKPMMQQWADYCAGKAVTPSATVIPLRGAAHD